MRIARKKISQRITNASFAFILALSSVTASLPFVASQKVSAVPATVVYDSLASVSPDTNYASSGVQAHNYNELGDRIILSDDSQVLKTVSITMSSWALKSTAANVTWCDSHPGKCTDEGFTYPMTLKAYKSDLTPIGSSTVEIFIPWRPEGNPSCGPTSNGTNKGWKAGEVCYDFGGKAFNAVLDVSSASITVPQDVVLGFAYNTQTKGYAPTGETGPINSINIAYPNTAASIGTDQNTNEAYIATNAPATWGVTGTSFQTTDFGPGYGLGLRITAESDIPETTLNVKTGNSNSVDALAAGAIGDKFTVNGVATDNNDLSRVYVQLNKSTGGRFGGTTVHLNGTSDDWSVAYDASNLGFVNGDKVRAHVSVTDTTGKTKSVGWTDWMTVDSTKPIVSASTEPALNPTSITITATDSGVGIHKIVGNIYNDDTNALLDSNSSTTQNPFTVSLDTLAEGKYFVRYNAADKAGNISNTKEFYFTVDKTAPTVVINSPLNNAIYKQSVALRATVTDENLRHYWLQIKKNGVVQNIPGVTGTHLSVSFVNKLLTTFTAEGSYEVTLAARDAVGGGASTGNRSGDIVTKFIIDKSAPTIDLTNIVVSPSKLLSFDLDASDSGLAGLEIVAANIYDETNTTKLIELGSGNPARLNTPHGGFPIGTGIFNTTLDNIDVSVLPTGTYTIRAFARDHAGNELRFQTAQFAVDSSAPVVTYVDYSSLLNVITPNIIAEDANLPLTYNWTPANATSAANVAVSDTSILAPTFTVNVDGTYTFNLVVTDKFGNASTPQAFTFTYTTPPSNNGGSQQGGTPGAPASTDTDNGFTNVGLDEGNNEDVLGESESQDSNQPSDEESESGEVLGTSTDDKDSAWAPFGIVWYWWLLILAALAVLARLFVAVRRRLAENEA